MGFGASVSALLETYSNCISLLKTYRRRGGDADSSGTDQQSLLRRSLKADRATVRRTYSSRLSQSGSQFERGDARARSALARVLRKLSAAIVNLLHLASRKDRDPALDYGSLMALSNSSRLHAVKAMDQLSQRLTSPSSRGSVVLTSSSSSSSSSSSHKGRKPPGSTSRHTPRGGGKSREGVKRASGPRPPRRANSKNNPGGQGGEPAAKTSRKTPSPTSPARKPGTPPKLEKRASSRGGDRQTRRHRMSMMTVSSGSTRLGEVPERRRHAGYLSDYSPEEYNVRPAFPLRPYKPEVKERRFWGLFRRG